MNALALAKTRTARRSKEGGAIMFVVAMTTAVLASVGVFAIAAAATEVRMSGNERQNTQTHYLSEYGVLAAAREMTTSYGDLVRKAMQKYPDTKCVSLANVPATTTNPLALACKRIGASELGKNWAVPVVNAYGGNVPYAPGIAPGSLGTTPMNADFFIEVTEPKKAPPPPGYSTANSSYAGGMCFTAVTVTSSGITQPLYPTITSATASTFGGEGIETQRARIIFGPGICP